MVWGLEQYTINGQRQVVAPGKLLFVNHGSETEVQIQAVEAVEGLNIYLDTSLLANVWTTLHQDLEQPLELPESTAAPPGVPEVLLSTRRAQLG